MKRLQRICFIVALSFSLPVMLLGAVTPYNAATAPSSAKPGIPVATMGTWVDVCTDLATADNGGSTVVNPSLITRTAQGTFAMTGAGTTVQLRVKYTVGTTITACTIQPFGFDANGIPERLFDATSVHALSFLSDATNDVQDNNGKSYTTSQEVDANGAVRVLGAVKVLATGTGAATAVLQMRVK